MLPRGAFKKSVYLLILIVPFLLFFSRFNPFTSIKFIFIKVVAAPMRLLAAPMREAKKILYYHRTFDEYQRLRTEVEYLRARLIGVEEIFQENQRLEGLLAFKRRIVYPSVVAQVIGRDPSRWHAAMVIDKGREHGIEQGMPVVSAQGVVGKISEVGADHSKVILLTDPQFSVAALVQRPRESGVVSGSLQGLCRMRYIQEGADIRVGDKVITSTLSSTFPESLFIGEVVRVQATGNKNAVQCWVAPAVALSQLEEILVILTK